MTVEALYKAAVKALKLRDFETALRYALQLTEQAPDHPGFLLLLGNIHSWTDQHEIAERTYRKALEIDPDNPEILNNLAVLLKGLNRTTEAETLSKRALKQAPERGGMGEIEGLAPPVHPTPAPTPEDHTAAPRAGVKRLGSSSTRKSSRSRTVHQQVEFKKAIYELKNLYIGQDGDMQMSLEELIEEWNPLVDEKAKRNLVEDVNSAVKDFLRKLKRSLLIKPPDEARIKNLSKQIADYEAFKRIKRKDPFRRYIELYMIKLLSLR